MFICIHAYNYVCMYVCMYVVFTAVCCIYAERSGLMCSDVHIHGISG